jgi:sulfite exporter TauE/SafE
MNNKFLGYIIAGVGILVLALSFKPIRDAIKLTAVLPISDITLMIAGAVILIVGVYLATRGAGSQKVTEVPIYEGHGKERRVVAIQRLHKK